MMNVTYCCPACQATTRAPFTSESTKLTCSECRSQIAVPEGAVNSERFERCLVCPSTDLFARKDFPQRLGVVLVILGFGASCVTWAHYQVFWTFAILFFTAFVDLALY